MKHNEIHELSSEIQVIIHFQLTNINCLLQQTKEQITGNFILQKNRTRQHSIKCITLPHHNEAGTVSKMYYKMLFTYTLTVRK